MSDCPGYLRQDRSRREVRHDVVASAVLPYRSYAASWSASTEEGDRLPGRASCTRYDQQHGRRGIAAAVLPPSVDGMRAQIEELARMHGYSPVRSRTNLRASAAGRVIGKVPRSMSPM